MRTLVIEREKFPREKVCGDCINPSCWPVLERLDLATRVRSLAHGQLRRVDFIAIGGYTIGVDLPAGAEIAVKRSLFDQLLFARAAELGAEVRDGVTVTSVRRREHEHRNWRIESPNESFESRVLVAADGRNSTVARLLGLLSRIAKERVALQTHVPLPRDFGPRVVLEFLPQGYSGQAPVGDGELNVCLVGRARDVGALRSWAESRFGIAPDHQWRTITPLRRAPLRAAQDTLFLVGDVARVVEPFTGEGIAYALRSGELAAEAAVAFMNGNAAAGSRYTRAHDALYRGRLWINNAARIAVLSPHISSALMRARLLHPKILSALTKKVVH